MSLTIANTAGSGSGSRILYTNPTTDPQHRRHGITFPTSTCSSRITRAPFRTLHVVSAAKKLSSRTGRFDSKNRRGNTGAITTTEEDKKDQQQRTAEIGQDSTNINNNKFENAGVIVGVDGSPMPELPGLEPDFWEGPQWGAFGFFLQYLWAFGIVFAVCVTAWISLTFSGFGIIISKGRVCVRMVAFVDNISLRGDSSAIIHTYNLIKRISDFF